MSSLRAVKSIPGKAHDTASFGDIAQLGGQIEKSGLVLVTLWLKLSTGNSVGMVPG